MTVILEMIELIGAGVVGIGIVMAAAGGIQWGQANAANDGAAKSTALALVGGGAVIALIGFVGFPMIADYFGSI